MTAAVRRSSLVTQQQACCSNPGHQSSHRRILAAVACLDMQFTAVDRDRDACFPLQLAQDSSQLTSLERS